MKLLFSYLKVYWKLVALALVLATINQVFSLLDPYIFKHIIDDYVNQFGKHDKSSFFRGVGSLLLAAVGVAFVSRIAKNFQDYFVNVITQKVGAKIYADGIMHSLELPYSVFEDQRSGETLGKLQKVKTDVERLISTFINVLFTSLVAIVFVTVYAINVHWIIAPIYFGTIPLLGILSSYLSRKVKTIQKKIVAETTALAGATTESLRNIELVKSLGLAGQEIKRLNDTTTKILDLELKKVRYIRSLSFIQGTCVNLLRTAILFVMLYLIFDKQISIGQFFTMFIYSFYIFGPLQELGNIINVYREAEVSLANFEEILAVKKEPKAINPEGLGTIDRFEFNHVHFKHPSSTTKAIVDVDFKVEKGETIAFVGPSGSGKTTLVKLLVGLYTPLEGEVTYNGKTSSVINLDELRSQIGLVTQDTQLFSGTIRENLLFVAPNASDDECMSALKKAALDNLLNRADKGLDTIIGEGGVKVSGGERQRLSISRALLRKPSLLIFDEATSALDSLTEEEINSTVRAISKDSHHISVLIAHRLSTVMHADRIYVMERGCVVEQGKHEDLLQEKGLYYAMWRQQIGERKL